MCCLGIFFVFRKYQIMTKQKIVVNEIVKIFSVARENSLTQLDLLSLSTIRNLLPSPTSTKLVQLNQWKFPVAFVAIVFYFIFVLDFRFIHSDSNCLIPLSRSLQNAFVPQNQCHICRNITSVSRRHSLDPEEFSEK